MNLQISPSRLVSDIQDDFNREFAFLKLQFFNKRALSHSDYSASQIAQGNRKIGDIQLTKTEGNISIDGKMKLIDLEMRLRDDFSLAVQVFRKSGNLWLETTMTDSWTLNQQNKHGKELSTDTRNDTRVGDYDLSRDADH